MAQKKKDTKTEITKSEKSNTLPAEMADQFEDDAGAGQESMGKDDFAIPRLAILQALSPQVLKQKDEYIEGAEIGMIYDSVSGQIYDGADGIVVIPVSYRRAYIEWRLREDGGGFVADHGAVMPDIKITKDAKKRDITPDGTQIVNTAEYFAFIVDKETGANTPVVISMASTQLKKSRRWNTMINSLQLQRASGIGTFNPAMFYRCYLITTVPESNNQGDWFGWKIVPDVDTISLLGGAEIYSAARDFHAAVQAGDVKVANPAEENSDVSEGDDGPM